MTTRHILRWHFTPRDVAVLLASGAVVVLDAACAWLEGWIDAQGLEGR